MSYIPDNVIKFCPVVYTPDNKIVFGDCNITPPAVTLSSNVVVTINPVITSVSSILFKQPLGLSSDYVITDQPLIASTSSLYYKSMVSRQLSSPTRVGYSTAVKTHSKNRFSYTLGNDVAKTIAIFTATTNKIVVTKNITTTNGIKIGSLIILLNSYELAINTNTRYMWAFGIKTPQTNLIRYSIPKPIYLTNKARYLHTQRNPHIQIVHYSPAIKIQSAKQVLFNNAKPLARLFTVIYTHGKPLTTGINFRIPNPYIPPRVPSQCGNKIIFKPLYGKNKIRFGSCLFVFIPERSVYFVPNSFSLMAGSTEIRTLSFNLSLDSDSFAWQWNATVDHAQFASIISIDQFNPIDVTATINGTPFDLIIEKVSTERSNCSKSLSISGRGITAYLSAPYSEITTSYSSAAITAQQAAEASLTVNGVPIGWTIDWNIDDWLIATGAWSSSGTYIEHLSRIAEAGGGYLQPHDTQPEVKFKKYYPTAPWNWNSADIQLPEAVVVTEGIEYSFKPSYTGVYVHGGASGGRLDLVKKTSTPGDKQAPIVVDDLATDTIMTRQRGLRILGDTGTFAMLSISLPILTETGIIRPGTMVNYMNRYGIVRGVSVSLGNECKPKQTIEVETHEYL